MRPLALPALALALSAAAPAAAQTTSAILLMQAAKAQERRDALDFLSGAAPRAAITAERVRDGGPAPTDGAIVVPRHIASAIVAAPVAPFGACEQAGAVRVSDRSVYLHDDGQGRDGPRRGSATVGLTRDGCANPAVATVGYDLLGDDNGKYRIVVTSYAVRPLPAPVR